MGFPKGRSGSSFPVALPFGRPRGFKPRGRYNLISLVSRQPPGAGKTKPRILFFYGEVEMLGVHSLKNMF